MTSNEIIQKFCKWLTVFAGWQLGTRSKDDAESQAVRDHREVTMLLRAEVNALTALFIKYKLFSAEEFGKQVAEECAHLDREYEKKFPGFSTTLEGVNMDIAKCLETTKNWRP